MARIGTTSPRPRLVVFAPSTLVTVTVEDGGAAPEVHLHAGGQGFWVARMAAALGAEVQRIAAERAGATGARVTLTDDPDEGLGGADFVYTDVWVSMGEPKQVWTQWVRLLGPYQINRAALDKTGNQRVKFMHCLAAFHDKNTKVGGEIVAETGMHDGLEVTHDVFESPASVVFDQAENRLHAIKAVLVATLGSG